MSADRWKRIVMEYGKLKRKLDRATFAMSKGELSEIERILGIHEEMIPHAIQRQNISERAKNVCLRAHPPVLTVEDLASHTKLSLFRTVLGCGRRTVNELESLLESYGLKFKPDEQP